MAENHDLQSPLEFRLHWSWEVRIITRITLLVLLFTLYYIMQSQQSIITKTTISLFLLALALWSVHYSPRYLIIHRNYIEFKQWGRRLTIPLESVTEIAEVAPTIIRSAYGLGSSGFCGFMGKYYHRSLGGFTLFATDRSSLLLLSTFSKKYVVSCPDPQQVIRLLQQKS